MRAGPERATGVDHHTGSACRNGLPGRPDPEPADRHRAVELAPPLVPTGLDRDRARARKRGSEPLLERIVRVGGELDLVAALDLLEPFRRELDEQRAGNLRLAHRHGDRDAAEPAYRSALFSRRKNPSSSSTGR